MEERPPNQQIDSCVLDVPCTSEDVQNRHSPALDQMGKTFFV